MQAVGGDEVAGRLVVDEHVVAGVADRADRLGLDLDARPVERVGQGGVEGRAAHPAPGTGAEDGLRGRAGAVDVADAGQGVPVRVDAEGREVGHGSGHQALAARLVDGAGTRLAHDDVEPGAGGVQRDGQADRAAAGDDEVTHRWPRARAGSRVRRPRHGSARSGGRR